MKLSKHFNFVQSTTYVLTILISSFAVAFAYSSDFDYVNAEFDVYKNGSESSAENILKINRDKNLYSIYFNVDHFLGSVTYKANFNWQNCHSTPINSYSKVKALGLSKTESVAYDYPNKIATITGDNNKQLPLSADTLDGLSFFLEARCQLMDGKKEFSYPVVRKGKISHMTYKVIGTETISTGIGDIEALKIKRKRSNNKRETLMWVAPSFDYMLVKIAHHENSLLSGSAVLKSLDYKMR